MSIIDIINSTVVYRNPLPHVYSRHGYFPSVVELAGGELLAAFSIGQAFESADMHTVIARSTDGGITWVQEGRLYPGTLDRPTSDVCRLSHGADGEVIAYVIRHDRSREDHGLVNPDNLGFVEIEQLLFRSCDSGHTWSNPQRIQPPLEGPAFEMTSPIVPLSSGEWLLPTSTWRGWDGYCPNGMRTIAFVSSDRGESWTGVEHVMVDPEQRIIYWESKIAELADSRLVAVAWTYDESANADLPIHYAVSEGLGQGWSEPQSTGLIGQTINLTVLPDGRLLSVYRRTDIPGLWANVSRLEGNQWLNETEAVLWDGHGAGGSKQSPQQAAVTGVRENDEATMQQKFASLKLGAPAICPLGDGSLLVAFWVVIDGVSQIQSLKLRIGG